MKILHVVDKINQQLHGGSAVAPYQLAHAQARLGHDVTIYTSDYQAGNQNSPAGVRLVKFKTLCSIQQLHVAPGLLFADYSDYDIVHAHNYRTLVNLLALNHFQFSYPPVVIQAHGNALPIAWNKKLKPAHDFIWSNLVASRGYRFIADAEIEIEHYQQEGIPLSKIVEIPVGVDLGEYAKIPERNHNGHKTVLYLGRISEEKGLDLLLNAFDILDRPDAQLMIAGMDYGYEKRAREKAMHLAVRDRINFVGPLYGADKVRAYTEADVFVMPSRYEMWGMAFMEALVCGSPVIMTNRCGAAQILPRECGSVVPLDEAQMAGAISEMLRFDFARYYRDYRRRWASQYSWDSIARKTIDLYNEVLVERCVR